LTFYFPFEEAEVHSAGANVFRCLSPPRATRLCLDHPILRGAQRISKFFTFHQTCKVPERKFVLDEEARDWEPGFILARHTLKCCRSGIGDKNGAGRWDWDGFMSYCSLILMLMIAFENHFTLVPEVYDPIRFVRLV